MSGINNFDIKHLFYLNIVVDWSIQIGLKELDSGCLLLVNHSVETDALLIQLWSQLCNLGSFLPNKQMSFPVKNMISFQR